MTARGQRVSLARKVAFLRDPENHADRPRRVTVVETHFAWVFLTRRFAYKLKKPARQAGMDYRSLAARARGCRAELALNRRLAPRVYLALVPLTCRGEDLRLGGGGRVVDWLVKMKRLPERVMLVRHLRASRLRGEDLDALARLLACFYRRAEPAPLAPRAYLRRLAREIRANRDTFARLRWRVDPALVTRVADAQLEFLGIAARALGARGAHVVEAHGDLRAEHVCLKPLAVIDCLEFDRRLRLLDPMQDVALLALEIERAGHGAAARHLLDRVAALTGDGVPSSISHFYASHRAATRAKLAAWHVGDPAYPDPAPWLARADACLREAFDHVRLAIAAATVVSGNVGRRVAVEQRA